MRQDQFIGKSPTVELGLSTRVRPLRTKRTTQPELQHNHRQTRSCGMYRSIELVVGDLDHL